MSNRRHYRWIPCVGMIVFGFVLARAGTDLRLPRLPEDFVFTAKEGSLGPVVFRHRTHVDVQRPNCTTCHSRLFKILTPGAPADGLAMSHDQMLGGKQCGACHNGKAAFDFNDGDKCMACHRTGES